MSHPGKKWVIVFLIYADFRIDPKDNKEDQELDPFAMNEEMKIELNLMFKEILTTPINPENARLYVILNGVTYKFKDKQKVEIENQTILYELVNPDNKPSNQFGRVRVLNHKVYKLGYPNPDDLQNPEKLSKIFKRIKVKEEEEVFLITWDHGSAFGIFREENPIREENPNGSKNAEVRKSIDHELDKYPYLKVFWEKALRRRRFRDFIDNAKKKRKNLIIQSRHNLYTVSHTIVEQNLAAEFLKKSNLNGLLEVKEDNYRQHLLFIKEKGMSFFAIEGIERLLRALKDGIRLEEKVTEILKNDELAKSLKCWLGTKKVGVLLMMNCWMMNLHTMYSLRKTVQCLVAPQGNIAIPAYNYRDILTYLYKPKSYFRTNQELAIKCVKTCENKFAKKRAREIYKKLTVQHDKIDSWKIIAIDLQIKDKDGKSLLCKQIKALKNLIDRLNLSITIDELDSGIIKDLKQERRHMFKYVRSVSYDFTDTKSRMVDIINWLFSVYYGVEPLLSDNRNLLDAPTRSLITSLKNITAKSPENPNSLILNMSKGKSVYETDDAVIALPPTGYSLFFPQQKVTDENLLDNLAYDIFLKNILANWKSFINNIYPNIIF